MKFLKPICAVGLGLGLALLIAAVIGESPLNVLKILYRSAFGTPYDFGMTLFYAIPLVFTGMAVSLSFHAGLFNIGAEGQLTLGAFTAAVVGSRFPEVGILGCIFAAMAGGALWGFIPGVLKAYRGSHEVILTMMLNFVAAGLTSWLTLSFFKNPESQNPETAPIANHLIFKPFSVFGDAPVGGALVLALLVCVGMEWFLRFSRAGFNLKLLGRSEGAAEYAGVSSKGVTVWALTLSGALAGLVGVSEVLGNAGKFKVGFSPDYGFLGIAVALLGQNKPLGILGSALLFAALHKGSSELDLETEKISKDFSLVIQAFVIMAVAGVYKAKGVRRK